MFVERDRTKSRESATHASPTHLWRANFRPAPPGIDEAPEAATGRHASEATALNACL